MLSVIKKYSLKNGQERYMLKVYLGIDPKTGKEVKTTRRGLKSYKEAQTVESRLRLEFENKQTLKIQGKKTFQETYEKWIELHKGEVKENTYTTDKLIIKKHILPRFGEMFIEKITIDDFQDAVDNWYSSYTKASHLVSLTSRIIDFGISRRYLKENLMKVVLRPRNTHQQDKDIIFYDKENLKSLLESAEEEYGLFYHLMFRLFAFTGLRKAELLGLMWEDIDEINSTMSVNRVLVKGINNEYLFQSPKTKSSKRTISLDAATMQLLRKWRTEQKKILLKNGLKIKPSKQLIFTESNNNHIPVEVPNRRLNKLIKKYDLPKLTIHGFRHTHCSLLFEAGIQMHEVKDRLGHSSIQTTMDIYTHITDKRKNETADTFANFMAK